MKQLLNPPHIILGGAALSSASTARAALNEYIVAPDALSAIDLAKGFFGGKESEVLLDHVLRQLGERIHGLRKARRFSQHRNTEAESFLFFAAKSWAFQTAFLRLLLSLSSHRNGVRRQSGILDIAARGVEL